MDSDVEVRTTPVGLFHYAHAYAASAIKLVEVNVEAIHSDAPVRYLFSHAIELYLKSYLLLQGVSVEQLRSRPLGHNLEELTDTAVKLGLDVSEVHCRSMAVVNKAILDRYIETGFRTVLLPKGLSEICSSLHEQIGPEVYKNAGITRKPNPYHPL